MPRSGPTVVCSAHDDPSQHDRPAGDIDGATLKRVGWWPDLDPEDYDRLAEQLRAARGERVLRPNPREREHREETRTGRSFWRCIPLTDAVVTPDWADLTDALFDIERWSKGLGPTMDNNDEDAGRGTLGRIHRRAREALDATPDRADACAFGHPGCKWPLTMHVTTPDRADLEGQAPNDLAVSTEDHGGDPQRTVPVSTYSTGNSETVPAATPDRADLPHMDYERRDAMLEVAFRPATPDRTDACALGHPGCKWPLTYHRQTSPDRADP